jgi:putative selenium metabolism hydrolase
MQLEEQRVVTFLQKAIRAKSISGNEEEMAKLVKSEMEYLNFDKAWIDSYGNIIGYVKGNKSGTILFEGHMDTVGIPSPKEWSHDPFAGYIEDNKMFGRGTCDMKSSLCAMVEAGGNLIASGNRDFCSFYVVGVVYEEIFEGVSFGKVLDELSIDAVILGEPSDMKIMLGQKGRAELKITTFGKNAHSAFPEAGINALYNMNLFLTQLPNIECPEDKILGKGIMVPTDICSSPYPGNSVIPDNCVITVDRRLTIEETKESVLNSINVVLDKLTKENKDFKAKVELATDKQVCYTGKTLEALRFFPAWNTEKGSRIAKAITKAVEINDTIESPSFGTYAFCTDGSESAGKRKIPTIGFGPTPSNRAHIVNEFVELDKLIETQKIFEEIIRFF